MTTHGALRAVVTGGSQVGGTISVMGSKIAAVPVIAATLLTDQVIELENLPRLCDIEVLLALLQGMGGRCSRDGTTASVSTASVDPHARLDDDTVTSVHGTMYLIPALLARFGHVRIAPSPGGCQIGERPIEHLLDVLSRFGADVHNDGRHVTASCGRLRGTRLSVRYPGGFDKYRSGATKTALLLGAVANGTTVIDDAYPRASITELGRFLQAIGADVEGAGSSRIVVHGRPLHGARFRLAGDYLEALTYAALVAACGGQVEIRGFDPSHCEPEIELLGRAGLHWVSHADGATVHRTKSLEATSFSTLVIDTDAQPMLTTAFALASGSALVEEAVWESRFEHVRELQRMGANLRIEGRQLHIQGVPRFFPASVHASDLRAGAALLIAAAATRGTSTITGLDHLARGYENLPSGLAALGVALTTEMKGHDARER